MERRGGRPPRIGERILVSYRDDDVWHEWLLVRALTEKSWLIVTLVPGKGSMRRLVLGRGTGAARDFPPGCARVHRFATVPDENGLREWVSRNGPEKDAWEHETGRIAVEQGLVLQPGCATIGFEEFVAGGSRHSSADRVVGSSSSSAGPEQVQTSRAGSSRS